MTNGTFVTFEGTEGSGKTTQIKLLKEHLEECQVPTITTKEPGGTSHGMQIRSLILDPYTTFQSRYTELMLFYADRFEHIESVIKPALDQNKVVICDRYIDSTIAYQIGGRKMPKKLIQTLNNYIDLMPTVTFYLDILPETGLDRAQKRAALDRFEQEDIEFHNRVRTTYLNQANSHPNRIIPINANNQSITAIHKKIVRHLRKYVPIKQPKKEKAS